MRLPQIAEVTSKEEARDLAIGWQNWAGEQSLSYAELTAFQTYFHTLAERFGLTEEFTENGII